MTDGYVRNALVAHATLGRGRVVVDEGEVVVVRFESGIASCPRDELERLQDLAAEAAMQAGQPLRVLMRALGAAISSVNDTWGVFSNSRIDLLPHQLWVCRKVLERWPTRWLVADDVGLGKTVEAGLVLTPLLASGRVQRLLVLAPASEVPPVSWTPQSARECARSVRWRSEKYDGRGARSQRNSRRTRCVSARPATARSPRWRRTST